MIANIPIAIPYSVFTKKLVFALCITGEDVVGARRGLDLFPYKHDQAHGEYANKHFLIYFSGQVNGVLSVTVAGV